MSAMPNRNLNKTLFGEFCQSLTSSFSLFSSPSRWNKKGNQAKKINAIELRTQSNSLTLCLSYCRTVSE